MSTDQSHELAGPAGRAGDGPDQGAQTPAPPAREPARAPARAEDQEPVPRLPRGRGLSLSAPEILRILMFAALLVAVITLRQPCASSAGKFINAFEPPPDAGPTQVRPGGDIQPGHYIRLTPDMSEDEIRRAIDQLAGAPKPGPVPQDAAGPAPAAD